MYTHPQKRTKDPPYAKVTKKKKNPKQSNKTKNRTGTGKKDERDKTPAHTAA